MTNKLLCFSLLPNWVEEKILIPITYFKLGQNCAFVCTLNDTSIMIYDVYRHIYKYNSSDTINSMDEYIRELFHDEKEKISKDRKY